MTDRRADPSLQNVRRGTLQDLCRGSLIGGRAGRGRERAGVIGFAVSGVAVVVAGPRWYLRADLPPKQLARLKREQAKAVTGAGAWRVAEDEKKYGPRSLCRAMT